MKNFGALMDFSDPLTHIYSFLLSLGRFLRLFLVGHSIFLVINTTYGSFSVHNSYTVYYDYTVCPISDSYPVT